MSFTTISLTGAYATTEGAVQFRRTAPLVQTAPPLVIPNFMQQADLDGSGNLSIEVLATNDPGTTPLGVAYEVTELIPDVPANIYFITVPFDAPSGTIDITACPRVLPTPFPNHSLVLAESVGRERGVASLDDTGNVPLSQLGNAAGGGGGLTLAQWTVVAEQDRSPHGRPLNALGTVVANAATHTGQDGAAQTFPRFAFQALDLVLSTCEVAIDSLPVSTDGFDIEVKVSASNDDGTEALVAIAGLLLPPGTSSGTIVTSDLAVLGSPVGSDLSLSASGIQTTAGGDYSVMVTVYFQYD